MLVIITFIAFYVVEGYPIAMSWKDLKFWNWKCQDCLNPKALDEIGLKTGSTEDVHNPKLTGEEISGQEVTKGRSVTGDSPKSASSGGVLRAAGEESADRSLQRQGKSYRDSRFSDAQGEVPTTVEDAIDDASAILFEFAQAHDPARGL